MPDPNHHQEDLPDKELYRIHREEKVTFAKLNQPMTQEQPGQVSPITNGECVAAGKEYARCHGNEAWKNLCAAWGMDEIHPRVKEIFIAGLAMGFVEALKVVRDAKESPHEH